MSEILSPYEFFINEFLKVEEKILNSKEFSRFDSELLLNNSIISLSIKAISKEDFNNLILDFYTKFKNEEEKEAQIYFSFHKLFRQVDVTDSFPNVRVFSFSINTLDNSQKESFRSLNSLFDSTIWTALSKDNSFFEILKKYIKEIEVKNEVLS